MASPVTSKKHKRPFPVVPAAAKPRRRVPRTAQGLLEVPDDFNEHLPDDILDLSMHYP